MKISNAPFFILSPGRSGTSLLSRMLNQHPRIAVPYESHLFNTFYPLLLFYGDLSQEKNRIRLIDDMLSTDVMHDWDPRLTQEEIMSFVEVNDFGGIFRAILRAWTKKSHKQRWGEKTPHHIHYWKEIREFFPEARFIHMIRDGRDVGLSFLKARFGPKSIYGAARYWKNYLALIDELKSSMPPEKYFVIRYEDLLDEPEKTLSSLCGFLGEEYVPQMLEYYKNKVLYKTDKRNQENLQKALMRDNKGKWRTKMSEKDIRIFEAVAGEYLAEYGYEPVIVPAPSLGTGEKYYCRFIEGPFKKLLPMLKNRKGHKDAWIKCRIRLRLKLFDRFLRKDELS